MRMWRRRKTKTVYGFVDLKRLVKRTPPLLSIVDGARRVRRARRALGSSKKISFYLDFHQIRKLQIGSGTNLLEGWLNTDYSLTSPEAVFLDATKPFGFKDGTFDFVFSEHQIEQLGYLEAVSMLGECFRVLKPGGAIRLATTSLEALLSLHSSDNEEIKRRYIEWMVDSSLPEIGLYEACFVLNNAFHKWGKRFLYDQATLQRALEKAGFIDVRRCEAGESQLDALRGVESHGKLMDNEELTRFETMVLEAVRPA